MTFIDIKNSIEGLQYDLHDIEEDIDAIASDLREDPSDALRAVRRLDNVLVRLRELTK